MGSGPTWTKEEIQRLKELYPKSKWSEILNAIPNRSKRAIYYAAQRFDVKRETVERTFDPEDPKEKERRRKIGLTNSKKLKGKHISPRTEFTSERLKKLWEDPDFVAKMKKRVPWNKGKSYNAIKGDKNPMRCPEILKKCMSANGVKPSNPEIKLQQLLERTNYPFEYVGDGKMVIGGKCPDFTRRDGKRQLIELFGDYWHDEEEVEQRINFFKEKGYDCLVIWEHELDSEDEVIHRIRRFAGN